MSEWQADFKKAGMVTDGKDLDFYRNGILTMQKKPVGRIIGAQTVDSSPVTNTTTETAFDKAVTIPSGTLKVGDTLRIRTSGRVGAANSTDTLRIALSFTETSFGGPAGIQITLAVDVESGDIWAFDSVLTVDGLAGGFVTFRGSTFYQDPDAAGTAPKMNRQGGLTAGLNSFAIEIGSTATWSVANAGNSCIQETLVVELYENR